jgi:hypothetical protein
VRPFLIGLEASIPKHCTSLLVTHGTELGRHEYRRPAAVDILPDTRNTTDEPLHLFISPQHISLVASGRVVNCSARDRAVDHREEQDSWAHGPWPNQMKMCGRQILLIVVALASASWTGSMLFSTFITGNYGRSADNKNSSSKYHTNGSSSTELPLQETNGSFGWCLKSFLSGSVGGIMSVIVGYPLDLIKVRSSCLLLHVENII